MSRWSKGIISETIKSTGCSISKGTEVEYIRVKSIPNSFGFRLTEYEWHYKGNGTYIRTNRRIIEGLERIVRTNNKIIIKK